jgi:hypothetical protein
VINAFCYDLSLYLTIFHFLQEVEIRKLVAKIRQAESEESVLTEHLQVLLAFQFSLELKHAAICE